MQHRTPHFWTPWKRHWFFVACLFVLSPMLGYFISSDRGLLFGFAVGVFASAWLLWSARERQA